MKRRARSIGVRLRVWMRVRLLLDAVRGLPSDAGGDATALLAGVVRDLRPVEAFRPAIEAAFDALVGRDRSAGEPTVPPLLEALLSGSAGRTAAGCNGCRGRADRA